ncbi:hypothetical protein AJ80_07531 [Polytolypa hystricis UAMH7299]|uniref:N-acetyltransferase domain-containing protein n=1 Tax=Polytolypa hystricis (strain UAMH7299) TaxID=1447883 RepID=A0A2B7XPN7_POLH7|nr:hypothetical protein AJ80_07531 [Polytolypa hystricis UAMH7299]
MAQSGLAVSRSGAYSSDSLAPKPKLLACNSNSSSGINTSRDKHHSLLSAKGCCEKSPVQVPIKPRIPTAFMVTARDTPYTVTNSFKRGLMMHTYGRPSRRVFDDDFRRAAKKRRVEPEKDIDESETNLQSAIRESSAVILSSPSRQNSAVFSEDPLDDDDDDDLSTLPSSPPLVRLTPPVTTRKPTFSFLKRKRSSVSGTTTTNGTPLTEVNSNSVRPSTDPPKKKQQQIYHAPALKQMQIDLGVDIRKTCTGCGMEYVPSNAEDVALHKKFHEMNSSGVDLGKAFVRANASRWVYEAVRFDEGYVVIVDRRSSPSARNQAMRVLEVVNKELSAPEIDDATLWSQTQPPKRLRKNGSKEEADRFKVFLHMKDSKCIGLCLTERIWESHPVKRPNNTDKNGQSHSSSITVGEDAHPAVVGISRVWTSASFRRKGIAMDLLDCVVSNYIYGIEIPKSQIAFSQPTESGCRLLEAFFGPDEEWHVYKES